jgi:hypothetical protein
VRAGAEILVAGNAVFSHGDIRENARKLLQAARSAAAAAAKASPRLRRTTTAPRSSKSDRHRRQT